MKKSAQVTLTIVAAVGMAGCGRRLDPCEPASFNQQACQSAIDAGGYYWRGSWYPMSYHYPYPYYFDSYRTYVSRGGRVTTAPAASYVGSGGSSIHSSSPSTSGVERGGFGSTGAGHGAGE
jgi:hypothetical protein